MPLLHPGTGVPTRVRVQGPPRWVPAPFPVPRLVQGSPSRGDAAVSGMQGAVFLGDAWGEPCPCTLAWLIPDSRRAVSPRVTHCGVWPELWCWGRGKGGPQPAEPCGSSPVTPGGPVAPDPSPWAVPGGMGCSGCSRAPQDLGTHRSWARVPPGLRAACLGGEGVSASSPPGSIGRRRG